MRRFCVAVLLAFALTASAAAVSCASDAPVVKVGASAISAEELLFILSMNTGGDQMMAGLNLIQMGMKTRTEFAESVANMALMAQAAKTAGLDKQSRVAYELTWQANRTLAESYLREVSAKWDMSETAIRKYFDSHPDEFVSAEAVRVRHIQVATEAEANVVYEKLKKGENFDKLVVLSSLDKVSEGGVLGWMEKGLVSPAFSAAFFGEGVKTGLFPPIKTGVGWHVVEILERREPRVITWEEGENEARQRLEKSYYNEEVKKLRKSVSVTINDEQLRNLGGAPAPQ